MKIIGLTGSIGMGKTTTANLFKEFGAYVFCSDKTVHKLYDKGGLAVPLLKAVFPEAVKNGAVDRNILTQHLKKDPLNIKVLESFIHPMVQEIRNKEIIKAKQKGYKIFIADIPLLFETGSEQDFDKIIVVSAPKHIQRKRVLARTDMSEEKFAMILARQIPDKIKRQKADFIIDTSTGIDDARKQVKKIMQELEKL